LRPWRRISSTLSEAIPLTWNGLAAKARAFRKTYADSEHNLMRALMLDIAVLSGQLDRASARPEGDEDYANTCRSLRKSALINRPRRYD
jgi:hypothetical protein